jgi:hypothetical protein
MKRMRSGLTAVLVAVGSTALLAACSSTYSDSHGSRVERYTSVEQLAEDSALIAVGTVVEQTTATDIDATTPFTLSSFEITEVSKGDAAVGEGDNIIVRQIGSEAEAGPADLFERGATYLLYLTPSGLEGKLASQFYVTGGTAGIYQAESASRGSDSTDALFTHAPSDEGDVLPDSLSVDGATGN